MADSTVNDPDKDTALSSLLRIIDTTLWTVDPFAHSGDEHMSLLIGHPIAVMRARRKLDAALEALEEARAQLAAQPARSVMLGPIAARIGHRATNAAEAALELAHASEVARGRR